MDEHFGDEPSADPLLKNGGASVENSGASCEPRWIRLCRCRINGRQGTADDGRRDLNWLEIVARWNIASTHPHE